MREMTQDVLQIMDDFQMLRYEQKKNGLGDAAKDRCGFAFEPMNAFSSEPLEFIETALRLDLEAKEMFVLMQRLNRSSPVYYQLSGQFEKLLRQLGSCCITKAILEQQENDSFELLKDMTIENLRRMTAFNFRKCFSAFVNSRAVGTYNGSAFDFSIRWASLDKRLIATGEKIEKIKAGEIRISDRKPKIINNEHTQAMLPDVRDQSADEEAPLRQEEAPAFAEKGRALPVLPEVSEKSTLHPVSGKVNRAELEPSPSGREEAPAPVLRQTEGPGSGIQIPAEKQPDAVPRTLTEDEDKEFLREILLGDALDRGDQDAYEAAARASGTELDTIWRRFLLREIRTNYPYLHKIGIFGDEPWEPPPEEEEWGELFRLPEPAAVS